MFALIALLLLALPALAGAIALQNGVAVTGLSATTGNNTATYTLDVPAGASALSFKTVGSNGDADIYVKFGSAPTLSSYDCRPWTTSSTETCSFATPQTGTYYVMVNAYASFTGLSLTGSYTASSGSTPSANFTFTSSALTANFTDTSIDSGGTISSRSWNFGDSATSTATNPSHAYASAGTYNVSLTVTDNNSKTSSVTKAVTVSSSTNTNLALNKPATGSTSCNTNETPDKAVNGSWTGGNSDKFCSSATSKWLQVDLGSSLSISNFTIYHAGAGGESNTYDTKDFNIQTSADGSTWTTTMTVAGNTSDITSNNISTVTARYVKLNVTTPTQTTDSAARIYELQVYSAAQAGPSTVQVFDHIPQYGIYVSTDPANYTPPAGVMMWSHGTEYARMLGAAEKAQIGDDVALQIKYHAQCDNYDRFASVFYISMPAGIAPTVSTGRTTLVDFISPFSDAWQGAYANHTYPNVPINAFAAPLSDPDRDIWVGISGGSNPYAQDPCENGSHTRLTTDYKAVGFLYSLALTSTQSLTAGQDKNVYGLLSRVSETSSTFTTPSASPSGTGHTGVLMVSTAGYGAASGGQEYTSTTITIKDQSGTQVASFNDKIDCSPYGVYSPDGNPGIFTTSADRSWCPGAIVPTRFFNLSTLPSSFYFNVTVGNASPWVGDSNYRTSINVIEK